MFRKGFLLTSSIALGIMIAIVFVLLAMSFDIVYTASSIHYVSLDGNCGGMSPCYDNIQDAVNVANPGDEVHVAGGEYSAITAYPAPDRYPVLDVVTQVVYISKTIVLNGGYATNDWSVSNPETNITTIDGNGQGRALFIAGDISATVSGFHITGGDAADLSGDLSGYDDAGGGIYAIDVSTLTLRNNWIFSNTAYVGAGFALYSSNSLLENNRITDNISQLDGGGGYASNGKAVLTGNTISRNSFIRNITHRGGGVYLYYCTAEIDNNVITQNSNAYYGGGLIAYAGHTLVKDNTIVSNTASFGGGIYLERAYATVQHNSLKTNIAEENGGGIFVSGGNTSFSSNVVTSNTAECGGGIGLDVRSNGTFDQNMIMSNNAINGGGLCVQRDSNVTLVNNIIAENQSSATGGALYIEGASPELMHTTIARNSGSSGIYVKNLHIAFEGSYFSDVTLVNTILVSHTLGISVTTQSTVTLDGTLWGSGVWGNLTDYAGEGTIITGTANVWEEPKFVAYDEGNYHISLLSAAINKGIYTDVVKDIDDDLRSQDKKPDIGADETGLVVTIQAMPHSVQAGNQLTYTIHVTNISDVDLHTTITNCLKGQTTPSGNLVWSSIITAPYGVWTRIISSTVAMEYSGLLTSTVKVTTNEGAFGTYTATSTSKAGLESIIYPWSAYTMIYTDSHGMINSIYFPSGAVTESTTIAYIPILTTTPPSGLQFAGHAFHLNAYRQDELLLGFVFSVPITVTIHYSEGDIVGLDENSLMLEYWNGNEWEDAACGPYARHLDENWLAVPICHLSQFSLFGRQQDQEVPATIRKHVSPNGQVQYGDEITYTLVISGLSGTEVSVYDLLTSTTFARFSEQFPGVVYADHTITGTVIITPTNQITVSFVVQVGMPETMGIYMNVSNRACAYLPGQTINECEWSNIVTNQAYRPHSIFLPLVIRN